MTILFLDIIVVDWQFLELILLEDLLSIIIVESCATILENLLLQLHHMLDVLWIHACRKKHLVFPGRRQIVFSRLTTCLMQIYGPNLTTLDRNASHSDSLPDLLIFITFDYWLETLRRRLLRWGLIRTTGLLYLEVRAATLML